MGDFKQAIEYHTLHLSIARALGDRSGEACSYCNLSHAYRSRRNLKEADKYQKQALSISTDLGLKDTKAAAYSNLGIFSQVLGDFEQAIEYHTQHLSIAKELGDRHEEGCAYGNLGNAYQSLGNLEQAIEYHTQHLSIAKEVGAMDNEAHACYSLGCDFELSGALHEALDYYRSSAKRFDEMRALLQSEDVWKITFRNEYEAAYTALWKTLLSLERVDEALNAAEQGRAQGLMDLMKLRYDSELPASEALESKEKISDMLSDLSTQTVFAALESKIIHLWVLSTGRKVQFRQKEVEKEDAVTFLECLSRDALEEIQRKRSANDLRDELPPTEESGQEAVKSSRCKSNPLCLFHDLIIGPIADLLEGEELIIVPDGPLCLAPCAAFLDGKSRYLSESFRIRILPSLTSLKLITHSAESYHKKSGVLLVGDPCLEEITNIFGAPKFDPLPYARKEVEAIGEMLNISPLTGKEATKGEVLRRITSVAVVHIAAHGKIETGEILLAPNCVETSTIPEEDYYVLTMSDVLATKIPARLVVLSCCHSAKGKVMAEGVVGIARAFLGAGARSVLVSLWAIDDEATMEFMITFYRHLHRGCSASVALHQSMKCLRESEKFGEVEYWAPFILIGDDVTIEF